jgi:hypothetical protein
MDGCSSKQETDAEVCPNVDFYISSTVGLINALHITDFHRNWVDQGLLKPQDFNFNLLQYPYAQRIDLLPASFKQKVKEKYLKHLEWLRPLDGLTRATQVILHGTVDTHIPITTDGKAYVLCVQRTRTEFQAVH